MSITEQLTVDLKAAMLSGDKVLATTIRGLKSAVLYAEVAKGSREQGLADAEIIELFAKEAKKRQESADMYEKGGRPEQAEAELLEKRVIEQYLPAQLSDVELAQAVERVIAAAGGVSKEKMGQIIGAVKAEVGAGADGSRIATAVRERL